MLRKLVLSKKQRKAWNVLKDKKHTEILFGGAAGGGKSFIGCAWIISNCLYYPGTRYLIGRARLTALKQSTLLTFFDLLKNWELRPNMDYWYNAQSNTIKFVNGSEVFLKDLFCYPTDPEFDSLGSTEYTYAFIDEASQISNKAKQILSARLRYKHEEFGLIPKLFIASNPAKNFLYTDFYKPSKNNTLEPHRIFIGAVVQDNPFMPKHYIEQLRRLDKVSKERLLYGNWEYDDDPSKLFDYDKITDIFTNEARRGVKYCSVDVAGRGRDKTVVYIWDDLFIEKIYVFDNISNTELDTILLNHKVPRSNTAVDNDGVGFGLVKDLPGVVGFVNNSRAVVMKHKEELANYSNLKTQCWFKLSDYVNRGLIGCYRSVPVEIRDFIIEDLEQIKQKDVDKDQKIRLIGKDEIKENTGRSPDFGDALMMRMFFELKTKFEYMIM